MKLSSGFIETEIGSIPIDWSAVRVDKIAKVRGGKRLPQGRSLLEDETPHPYIRVSDMKNGTIGLEELLYVPTDVFPLIKRYVISKDDIYVSVAGTLGLFGRVPELLDGASLTENADKITEIDCDRDYLLYSLQTERIQAEIENKRTVGAQPKLAIREIEAFKIPLPATEVEQQAIAKALGDVDGLIASLEALIAKKRHIKQGAMQELLSGHRRTTPSKIGEVLRVRHGRSQWEVVSNDGAYPILASGGQIGNATRFLYDKPSVLIGRKGTIDRPQFVEMPFWTIDTLFYTEVFEPNIPKYVFYQFCMIDWRQYNEASGVPSLNASTIENVEIHLHKPDEQKSIVLVLSDMDAEIAALEAKLVKTRDVKQGMMQVLLTGEVRLI